MQRSLESSYLFLEVLSQLWSCIQWLWFPNKIRPLTPWFCYTHRKILQDTSAFKHLLGLRVEGRKGVQ